MRKLGKVVMGVVVLALPLSLFADILIDFSTAAGYSDGDLNGQPTVGLTWARNAGSANSIAVSGEVATTGFSDYGRYNIYDSPSINQMFYSFDFRRNDIGTTNLDVVHIQLGGTASTHAYTDPLADFYFKSDGGVSFRSRDTVTDDLQVKVVKNSGGTDFVASEDAWYTAEGAINFSTGTFTFTLDGVSQGSFKFSDPDADKTRWTFYNRANAGADWTSTSFDNFETSTVPEPATLGLVSVFGLGLLIFRRLRR